MRNWIAGIARLCLEPTGIIKKKYRIAAAVAFCVILLAGAAFLYYHNPQEGLAAVCPMYALTGFYCPGCGAGRACYAILHGQIYQAFRYNPLLLILLPWLGMYYLICGIQWLKNGSERLSEKIPWQIPLTILIILMAYGVVRNIRVYPFTLLAPTRIG